jgi:uncharacterized paraquat-inducible protein A
MLEGNIIRQESLQRSQLRQQILQLGQQIVFQTQSIPIPIPLILIPTFLSVTGVIDFGRVEKGKLVFNVANNMLCLSLGELEKDVDECPICYDHSANTLMKKCKHRFCQNCIYQHLNTSKTQCPLCRTDFKRKSGKIYAMIELDQ